MPVPFLGRLNVTEYTALVSSFFLVILEAIIRILTLALPNSLLTLFYRASRRLFNKFTSPAQKRAEERKKSVSTSIREASDFVELCRLFGYTAEEHVFQTKDGYLLGLHRISHRPGEEDQKVNSGPNSIKKRVVYMHHGLLMNSEVWVCNTDARRSLPFVLVDRGFDVWFGNNRGNKYSKKSVKASSKKIDFWNFSIDEFALYDIPDSIAYILETTRQPSLSYIGFSQGTAQAFAALAIHPKLNDQVNVFIALAPAMSPAGLSNGIVDALVKASPQILFLLFGRRSILSSATMWQSILYPPLFVRVIDLGLSFLFGWRTENISASQKLAAYAHLYSYTSTKSVVHWFQIIRTKSFQMYDDDVHPLLATHSKHTKVAKYPTRNIKTPVVLVYGGSDSLVDIKAMMRELPLQTVATEIPHYEHLDFLWARDNDTLVFPHVFDALDSFTGAEHTKEEYARFRSARHTSLSASNALQYHAPRNNSDVLESDIASITSASSPPLQPIGRSTAVSFRSPVAQTMDADRRINEAMSLSRSDDDLVDDDTTWSPPATPPSVQTAPSGTSATETDTEQFPAIADTSMDSLDASPASSTQAKVPALRKVPSQKLRNASSLSFDTLRIGKGGSIRVGSSKAVGGVTTEAAEALPATSSDGIAKNRIPSRGSDR